MPGPGTRAKTVAASIAVICMIAVVPVQRKIDSVRAELVSENVMPTQLPHAAAASAALGGFRGIAVDILWMQADNMINERQFYQLMTYYTIISALQPNFPSVWTFNAWNLAFNISAEWGQPDEKWIWIKKGIEFGQEGLKYNPDSVELNFYVGWLYYFKVGRERQFVLKLLDEDGKDAYLEAAAYFRKAADAARAQEGESVRYDCEVGQALLRHALFVYDRTGNLPETMRYIDQAEQQTDDVLVLYPDDPAALNLKQDIKRAREAVAR